MTYINDIFINLNYNYFEFYEWNKKDDIEHIKKIPIIKTNNKTLFNIIHNKIMINSKFISNYYQKCEKYHNPNHFNYVAITNGINVIIVSFNNNGNVLKKSSLIFEDEENICLIAKNMKTTKIPYNIIKIEKGSNLTRNQLETKKYILYNITKMSDNKLKYLYYDCFNQEEDNINTIKLNILKELKNNNVDIIDKCSSLLNLIYQQNK